MTHRISRCGLVLLFALSSHAIPAETAPRVVELELPAQLDPFAVNAKSRYVAVARTACAVRQNQGAIGYHWQLPAVAAALRRLNGESPGKQIYIAFLKSKYGYQIAKLNADYGTDAQSFTELLESPMARGMPAHDVEFDRPIQREIAGIVIDELRRCDPAHADFVPLLMALL